MLARNLPMFPSPPFPHPTRLGERHYVLVVKDFLGEMDALMQAVAAEPSIWDCVTPLIEVGMKNKGSDEAPRSSRLPGLPGSLASTFRTSPFFLDFCGVSARQKVRVGTGLMRRSVLAVDDTVQSCLNKSLNFIPVFYGGVNRRVGSLFREVAGDGRGACLRLRVARTIPQNGFRAEVDSLMDFAQSGPSVTDIVVDLGYIPPQLGYGSRHVAELVDDLARMATWRSLILVATVVPENHSGFLEDYITQIPRQDWEIWNTIREMGIARVPTFGDYGIQHPKSPTGKPLGMRAYIRYSTPDTLLVARGTELIKDGEYDNEQYRRLAQWITETDEFHNISEGDRLIRQCANGDGDPGDQRKWRAAGTNHHIMQMARTLSGLPERQPERSGASPLLSPSEMRPGLN